MIITQKTKILLTGGTGFIGSPVSRVLKQCGLNFTLAVYEHDPQLAILERDYDVVRVNLLTEHSRSELMCNVKPDVLIHLAWYAEPNNFWQSPLNMNWLYASLDLFKHFVDQGGKRCLMTGTCAEYDWSEGGCFSENTTTIAPDTFYGIAKDALRRACQGYAAVSGISFLWCRLFWPYGPGEPEGRLFSFLMKEWREGRIATCRAGNFKRDYMYVDDIAVALVEAAFSQQEGVMNVASGKSVALGDMARMLARSMGKQELLHVGEVASGPGTPEEIYADVGRLRQIYREVGMNLEKGILTLFIDP